MDVKLCTTVTTIDDNDVEESKDFFIVLRQESTLGDSVMLDDSFTDAAGAVLANATVVIISESDDCELVTIHYKIKFTCNIHTTQYCTNYFSAGGPNARGTRVTEDPPPGSSIELGENVTLSCGAVGEPPPTFQWFRNGIPLEGETRPTLEFLHVTIDDRGNIQL